MTELTDLPPGPPRHERNTYFGYLSLENVGLVFERLRELIGDQAFTFVACNEMMDPLRPEVRIERVKPEDRYGQGGMKLQDYGPGHMGISIVTPRYVTSFSTSLASEREMTAKDRERLTGPYFVFEGKQFLVKQRVGAGHNVSWTFAVE